MSKLEAAERLLYGSRGLFDPYPETAAERRRRADAEFMESIRLDNALPPITPAILVKSVQEKRGVWFNIDGLLRNQQLAAEEAARLKLEGEQIQPIEEPIF